MAKVLRTGQVAEILGVPTRTVTEWAKQKRLPTLDRLGGEYYRYPADQIMELKELWDAPEESPPEEREAGAASPVLGRPEETAEGKPKQPKKAPAISSVQGYDQRAMFIDHMTAIGVTPREAIPTIADLFFEGDIEDLDWLNRVLQRSAAGYVKTNQRRLMMDWWAKIRQLPYDAEEYFTGEELHPPLPSFLKRHIEFIERIVYG